MRQEVKLAALRTALHQEGEVRGDEVVFFCPKHGAKAGRTVGQLSVNLKTDWFNCWSCGFKSRNLYLLLVTNGKTPISKQYLEEVEDQRRDTRRCLVVETTKVYDPPALPPGFKSLSVPSRSPYYTAAMAYMGRRGLGLSDALRWKLGYCDEGEMSGRIIIPSFDEYGELNFVVGRAFYDDPLRYKPWPKHQCKDIVWNDYLVDWTHPVVVTEGPFDAFVAEDNATILQGTILPDSLVRKIVLAGTDVYFAMDADAFKRQLEYIELFLSYGITCRYVDIKGRGKKDLGAMTKTEFRERKAAARVVRNELDILKLRVMA
jgi:hypothetical protein